MASLGNWPIFSFSSLFWKAWDIFLFMFFMDLFGDVRQEMKVNERKVGTGLFKTLDSKFKISFDDAIFNTPHQIPLSASYLFQIRLLFYSTSTSHEQNLFLLIYFYLFIAILFYIFFWIKFVFTVNHSQCFHKSWNINLYLFYFPFQFIIFVNPFLLSSSLFVERNHFANEQWVGEIRKVI